MLKHVAPTALKLSRSKFLQTCRS